MVENSTDYTFSHENHFIFWNNKQQHEEISAYLAGTGGWEESRPAAPEGYI